MRSLLPSVAVLACAALASGQTQNRGYYRFPAIYGQTVVFTAEGDLWSVSVDGGMARRLTSHPGDELHAAFSPDGKTLAFSANYEGPVDIYTMPAQGGLPVRRTFEANPEVEGWTPDGKILYATSRYAGLPDAQLATIDANNRVELVPLAQAAQGSYDKTGSTLFFTRFPFQGSYAKRYQGGTAQSIWKYAAGQEAVALTGDFPGTSKNAMWWNGRVYFLCDRDGTMNIWSMDENGKNPKQLTKHQGWDAKDASLGQGRIVYQMGADLRLYDIASGTDRAIPIELSSDFDHLREHWITKPFSYATGAHVSPDGSRVTISTRGRTFVAPVKSGRFIDIAEHKPGRYRDAWFLDNKTLLVLSTESGEAEFWKVAADGSGKSERLTTDGKVLRWDAVVSPDGKWVANQDKDNQLWLLNVADKKQKLIATALTNDNAGPQFNNLRWSPDSRWLTWDTEQQNLLSQISLYSVEKGTTTPITTDRYDSRSATFSSDGKWIFFISDRNLRSMVGAPWGSRAPDPYFDKADKLYMLALQKGLRSPFEPADELHPDKKDEPAKPADTPKPADASKPADAAKPAETPKPAEAAKPADAAKPDDKKVEIDLDGIATRLQEVPVPSGNYGNLMVAGKRLCYVSQDRNDGSKDAIQCLEIDNKGDKPDTLIENVHSFELSSDGKKMFFNRGEDLFVVDASARGTSLRDSKTMSDAQVDLKNWTFSVIPNDEFREAFLDAWRLHRDYFYDKNMHGVNWEAMRNKYGELITRVRDREELNDLISQMVSELSLLHTFVNGGDVRRGTDQVSLSFLGARLSRDEKAGGFVVDHVYASDPDRPDRKSALARPGVDVADGDVLIAINNQDVLSAASPGELLRNQAGKQVLLRVRPKGKTETREVLVKPLTMAQDNDLRYAEWEYTRRLEVEKASDGKIGYIHLRAMGGGDMNRWVEEYSPIFTRQGLIIDVRHNNGGNIDSWILGKLLHKAWMYWQPRVGQAMWNMHQAFRGHIVVLCDQWTASDGEAFTEGFRRLGLGKAVGMRTWGGEVWLSASNYLADRGIATTGENGVFGPDKKWLIEGHGVDPDIVVDNLPHATFEGKDAQLEAAIAELKTEIREKPVTTPATPAYPNKSFSYPTEPPAGGAGAKGGK